MIAVGLMSGTSLDGIDAALVRIVPRSLGYDVELLVFETLPFGDELASRLRTSLPPNAGSVAAVAELHRALGDAFARAAVQVCGERRADYAASHGQTLWHDGDRAITLQAGDPFAVREALQATVCFDFRSADCAAGGQGAPLIPYVDALLFAHPHEDRVAVNLGGIANVTLLPKGATAAAAAFDTGPGNMLLDALVRERTAGASRFDEGGSFAAAGRADHDLVSAMLDDDYFRRPAPKSTGRERFGEHYLEPHGARLGALGLEDAAATLTEVTAASVADAVSNAGFHAARVIVSGGGARNATLLDRIAARLPGCRVEPSDAMGIPTDAKEAMGFALLGYETLRGRASNVPQATGASRTVPLGAIAPWNLRALLDAVEAECAACS